MNFVTVSHKIKTKQNEFLPNIEFDLGENYRMLYKYYNYEFCF